MKSKDKKANKEIEKENKLPPSNLIKEEKFQKEGNTKIQKKEKNENKNNTKNEKESTEVKQEEKTKKKEKKKNKKKENKKKEITEDQEKEMLKGEDHISENDINLLNNNNNIFKTVEPLKDINPQDNIISEELQNNYNTIKKTDVILIKPRESYLKEKINQMEFNPDLLTEINKSLDNQVGTVANKIRKEKILITDLPTDLKKYISPTILSEGKEIRKDPERLFDLKNKYKTIKELNNEKKILQRNLTQIEENEKLYKDKNFTDISNIKSMPQSMYDKSIEKQKIKSLKEKKAKLIHQLSIVDFKINDLLLTDNFSNKKEKLKSFIDNFERDKEIAEIRAKKYLKESKLRRERMSCDINKVIEKRRKDFENQTKDIEQKKEDFINKFKLQEKAIEEKRLNENNKKVLQFKEFIHEKPKRNISSYLFTIRDKDFQNNEEKLIKLENIKRKEFMKSLSKMNIGNFKKNYDENKEKKNIEFMGKKKILIKEWKERKRFLPKYVSPAAELDEENFRKIKENEEEKKSKQEALIKIKKDYSLQVKEEKRPIINKKLMQERLNKISQIEDPKAHQIKATLSYDRKKRIILKKPDPNKPSKFPWKLKIDEDPLSDLNNNDSLLKKNLIKKPKIIFCSTTHTKREIPDKKIDYLKEIKESKNKNKITNFSGDFNNNGNEKWEKILNNKNGTIRENICDVKDKAEILENEAIKNEQLLRVCGGVRNNPELSAKVSGLIIDSIKAKLSIINKMVNK